MRGALAPGGGSDTDQDNGEHALPIGFFLCKIKTLLVDGKPMDRPLLQTKVKSDNGVRTIAPLGE